MRFHRVEEALLDPACNWFPEEGRSERIAEYRGCHKFYFGSAAKLPGDRMEWKNFPRLPYPSVACEIEMDCEDGTTRSAILLLREVGDGVAAMPFLVSSSSVASCGTMLISRATGESVWFPNGGWLGAPLEARKKGSDTAAHELAAAGLGLRVLMSSSVRSEQIAAPERLNRKRIRNGRVPHYGYSVLVLRKTGERIDGIGGSHDDPILHTVRGHWKIRETGAFFWEWHLRGDRKKGFKRKDYNAADLMNSMT